MTSFCEVIPQNYVFEPNVSYDSNVCICCTSQNCAIYNMNTCTHATFLFTHLNIKLDFKDAYICAICHSMLKKIDVFKQQVEESVSLLLHQAPILKVNTVYNLQISRVQFDDVKIESDITPVQPESPYEDVKTDLKVEIEVDNEFEVENPPDEVSNLAEECIGEQLLIPRQKKSKKGSLIEGKIKMIILSKEELEEERLRMGQKENYLRLPYKCEDCVLGFDHELSLKDHMDKRHQTKGKMDFQCDVCKSILKNKMTFNEHMRRHYRRLECLVCKHRYIHLQSAVQHYDEHHATSDDQIQKGYTCEQCGFETPSNRVYRYHMDKHKKKSECKICGNTFVNTNGLKVHMYTIHKQSSRVYKCDKCNVSYQARSGLISHMRSAHNSESKAFCVPCDTIFRSEQGLLQHLKTHSKHVGEKDKRFICDECGAKFMRKSKLQQHINWEHLKIDTHRCSKCDKVFKNRAELNRHVNYVHDKKRPPRNKICDYCGRGFTTQTILKSHIRTHTGERPLQCTKCPATFAHSAALYTHNKLLHKWKE